MIDVENFLIFLISISNKKNIFISIVLHEFTFWQKFRHSTTQRLEKRLSLIEREEKKEMEDIKKKYWIQISRILEYKSQMEAVQ